MTRRITEALLLAGLFVLPFSKSGAEIATSLVLVLWIAERLLSRRRPGVDPTVCAYLLFLACLAVSLARMDPALGFDKGLRGLFKWVQYLLLFFACRDLFRSEALRRKAVMTFLVSAALLTANGCYQMLAGVDLVKGYSVDIPGRFVRMRSSLGSPNGLAAFYLFALPLAFERWVSHGRWRPQSALWAACLLAFAYGLLATLSRAALLGLGISALAAAATRLGVRRLLAIGAILGALLFSSELMRQNFVTSLNPRNVTVAERLRFWKVTGSAIADKPVFGHGPNTYYRVFPEYAPPGETYRGYAHNSYLQIWAENGLVGLLLFLMPVGALLRRSRTGDGLRSALGVAAGAFLIQAFFDNHFFALQASVLFWIFWGMHAATSPPPPARTA